MEECKNAAKSRGATLRAQVSSHLRKHNHFRHGWTRDSRWTETTEGGAIPKNYSDWVEATARPTRWICGPTLVTAAIRLSRNIVIFQWKDEEWKQSAFLTRKEACEAAAAHPPLPLFLNSGVPNSAPFPHAWYRPLDVVLGCRRSQRWGRQEY